MNVLPSNISLLEKTMASEAIYFSPNERQMERAVLMCVWSE